MDGPLWSCCLRACAANYRERRLGAGFAGGRAGLGARATGRAPPLACCVAAAARLPLGPFPVPPPGLSERAGLVGGRAVPPSARQAPAPAGRMEGPVSGRVACGPAPPTIGRGGWVRVRGWRSGPSGLGARAAGAERRPWPAVWRRPRVSHSVLSPVPPPGLSERAGGRRAQRGRSATSSLAGQGTAWAFPCPFGPPAPSRPRAAGPGLAWKPASSSLEQGLARASPHRPLAPSRAEGGGVGFGRGPAAPPTGRCPAGRTGEGGPWARSGQALGEGPGSRGRRRGCLPWPPGPSGPCPRSCGLRARADNYRGDHLRQLRRAASSPSGPVGGLARTVRGHPAAPASPAPVPESGAGFGGGLAAGAVGGAAFPGPGAERPLPRVVWAESAAPTTTGGVGGWGPLLPLHPRESEAFTGAWVVGRAEGVLSLGVAQEGALFAVVLAEGPRRQPMAASLPSLTPVSRKGPAAHILVNQNNFCRAHDPSRNPGWVGAASCRRLPYQLSIVG
ncbi:hypothetical protein C7M84_018129 [Penaeus vannamei]|uniref:Uncharacterized protein n=1 Tax=Penaeus vannamei TaxID=6689 RepID=A0A423SI74_PENVA|nr:hypothetical protein C7M84_018129 [Penaeus vannamei]